MNSRKYLFVFIDSLPYERLSEAPFLAELPGRVRLIPTLGYSVNLLPELFIGQQPDEVGFFGEWTYKPESSPFPHKLLGQALQLATRAGYYPDRALHKLLGKLLDVHLAQIPFDLLPYFSHEGRSVYDDEMWHQTGFVRVETPLKVIRSELFPGSYGERDRGALARAQDELTSSIFLSLVDLDSFGHRYGVYSPEHDGYIRFLDGAVNKLWQAFQHANADSSCSLYVLSDHGMSNVHHPVSVGLDTAFGAPHPDSYMYFADSTLLRVWTSGQELRGEIRTWLKNRADGHLLTPAEREELGITAAYCGDHLYVLEEGYVFSPSFHGLRVPLGMHGYHPDVPLQHAVLASSEQLASSQKAIRSCDVSNLLRERVIEKT